MFHIILYEPEIPPNAGNIIRLSVNTGCNLHFIEPLGFSLDEKGFRRAGMDYMKKKNVNVWPNLEQCIQNADLNNIYSISTKGKNIYSDITYKKGDAFIFGPESRGLPSNIREKFSSIYIPMKSNGRSLNLANAVSIIVYEGWRKNNFQ
tara:strand:+ start:302 stop:748 length:447 start_codon:yes stop_codon:yes gene_type:complete